MKRISSVRLFLALLGFAARLPAAEFGRAKPAAPPSISLPASALAGIQGVPGAQGLPNIQSVLGAGSLPAASIPSAQFAGSKGTPADAGRPLFNRQQPSLRELYLLANPGTKVLDTVEREKIDFAAGVRELFLEDTFKPDAPLARQLYLREARLSAANEISQTLKRADSDPNAAAFVKAVAQDMARAKVEEHAAYKSKSDPSGRQGAARAPPKLIDSPLMKGQYWDMASGPNAASFILNGLQPHMQYSFFDSSPFVVDYLQAVVDLARARGQGVDNVRIIKADVNNLPQPSEPLAVLRSKNVTAYVPGFQAALERMTGWIAEGGMLLIQNDPMFTQRQLIIAHLSAMAHRLIEAGWRLEFDFMHEPGARDARHDTVTFTRSPR